MVYSDKSMEPIKRKFPVKSKIPVEKNEGESVDFRRFVDDYSKLFGKSTSNFGDPHSYFRHTLRNREKEDLLRDLRVAEQFLREAKSTGNVKKKVNKKLRYSLTARSPRLSENQDEQRLSSRSEKGKKQLYSPKFEAGDFPKPNLLFKELKPEEAGDSPRYLKDKLVVDLYINQHQEEEEKSSETEETHEVYLPETVLEEEEPEPQVPQEEKDKAAEMSDEEEVTEPTEAEMDTEGEAEGDDMEEVEAMIKQASQELEQVAEENQQLLDALGEDKDDEDTGSVFAYDSKIDEKVLRELEECERQAKCTAEVITTIKKRVAELMQKDKMTEGEAKELERMNKELKAQMVIFEEKTRRIQQLIAQANLFENYKSPRPALEIPRDEDRLPKVIVCGATENDMPKIIVCHDKSKQKRSDPCAPGPLPQQQQMMGGAPFLLAQNAMGMGGMRPPPTVCGPPGTPGVTTGYGAYGGMGGGAPGGMGGGVPGGMGAGAAGCVRVGASCGVGSMPPPGTMNVVPQLAQTLNESFCMQEKLANENQNLEGMRYKLQSDLAAQDTTVECLQSQLENLRAEMRMICKENSLLTEKLMQQQKPQQQQCQPAEKPRAVCERGNRGTIETRLRQYTDTTENLEKQLAAMERDVRNIQCDLRGVQRERQHLEQHRRKATTPAPPQEKSHTCSPPSLTTGSQNQQLCEIREQYCRLQDDFKSKLCEVAGLRADNEKFKSCIAQMEQDKRAAEDKVRELEVEIKELSGKGFNKESLVEMEQELRVARQRFREAQDELEELRALIEDHQSQLDDYRNKYIVAQQEVEEQRRHIDMMELENGRVSEQVNLEIQRVKNQFQEKLQELTPLPDVLRCTQTKLQEAQQMHMLAERNNEAMARELQLYKDKIAEMARELNELRGDDDEAAMSLKIEQLNKTIEDLNADLAVCRQELTKTTSLADEKDRLAQAKLHEIAQLQAQLEGVREESARQVARTKDRCETVRRSMQNQISDLERQLALSRAAARTAQKDRDEIRQKMQAQINNLNENFEDAQMRIRNLQGHVNFLKSSYDTVFSAAGDDATKNANQDSCYCGLED